MLHVLALVIPFGLAGAVSPVMLTEQTVVLAGPDGRRAAVRYAAGAMLVLLAYVTALVLFGRSISLPKEPHLDATLDVVVGAVLLVVALVVQRRGPAEPKPDTKRRAMTSAQAFGFGAVSMATNVTTLALVVPGAKEIASSHLELPGRAFCVLVLVILASIPAWLPVALTAVAPGPADRALRALGDLLHRHGRLLMVVVIGALGLFLVIRGVVRLAGL